MVMPPMSVNFGVDKEGFITEQHYKYLEARARSGTGMIVVGGGAVHPSGLDLPKMPPIWADHFIDALKKMNDIIHQYNVKIGMQLLHGGRQAFHDERVAPSPIPAQGVVKGIPRELTNSEIKGLVEAHGDAARRCLEAGFDFVEIHGAHGYLISEFLAKNSNKRQDEYGGPFENRIRFLLEVLNDVKKKTGSNFPVGVRINGQDYVPDGWTINDTKKIAPILEQFGADWLHISAGIYGSFPVTIPSMYSEQGCFVHLAQEVKGKVNIPIITVGRIKNPELADRIIKEGWADMVAMGRAHLADPEIAAKSRNGNLADIRPCIGCCKGCIDRVLSLEEATCVMNPEVGREYSLKGIKQAAQSKKILVIGAGPAGLAVSRMAALRGHKVIIAEESGYLGGIARLAAIPPGRSEIMDLINYYKRELDNLHVKISLNVKLDKKFIASINPAAVIIATGSLPSIPQIEGLFNTDMKLHTIFDVLEENSLIGDRIIILGGNQAGLEVADFLSEKDKKVVVLHRYNHFAEEMAPNDRTYLMERLKRLNVQLFKKVVIKAFNKKGIIFDNKNKMVILDNFTDLVLSEGMRSIRKASELFADTDIKVYTIGDAKSPRSLLESQAEADEVGRSL